MKRPPIGGEQCDSPFQGVISRNKQKESTLSQSMAVKSPLIEKRMKEREELMRSPQSCSNLNMKRFSSKPPLDASIKQGEFTTKEARQVQAMQIKSAHFSLGYNN